MSTFTKVCSFFSALSSNVCGNVTVKAKKGEKESVPLMLVVVALMLLTAPCELSQLIFAFTGALVYLAVNSARCNSSASKDKLAKKEARVGTALPAQHGKPVATPTAAFRSREGAAQQQAEKKQATRLPASPAPSAATTSLGRDAAPSTNPEYRKLSSNPVAPPTFTSLGYEAEVEELLGQIAPSTQGDKVVHQLARRVEKTLRPFIPEVEVVGFASGDLTRGTAFGVAVPEVDIVVNVPLAVLSTRMQGRMALGACTSNEATKGGSETRVGIVDERKLQKSAIRACTDRLVSQGGFKFRRSAFRGQEPKVTLLAPAAMGIHTEAIPIDFSVNIMTPLYNAALLAECGRLAPSAKGLILMVKRWAKDRGVCHAAKGHLSPYSWSLATVFFLQVGAGEGGAMLPPFQGFVNSAGQMLHAPGHEQEVGKCEKSVAQLFKEFVQFYSAHFDWQREVLSIRTGRRAEQRPWEKPAAPSNKDSSSGEETRVNVSIEDPFEPTRNLGACMTEFSLKRLKEELARADDMCSRDCSLTELLAPWVPPDRNVGEDQEAVVANENGDEVAA